MWSIGKGNIIVQLNEKPDNTLTPLLVSKAPVLTMAFPLLPTLF